MVKLRRDRDATTCVSCGREPARSDDPSKWKRVRVRGVRGRECPGCWNSHEGTRDDGISDPRQLYEYPLRTERAEPGWKAEARQRSEARSAELLAEA